jgi:hypothetical protein
MTLKELRELLVKYHIIHPDAFEDPEGYDNGEMMEMTRLLFEKLGEGGG